MADKEDTLKPKDNVIRNNVDYQTLRSGIEEGKSEHVSKDLQYILNGLVKLKTIRDSYVKYIHENLEAFKNLKDFTSDKTGLSGDAAKFLSEKIGKDFQSSFINKILENKKADNRDRSKEEYIDVRIVDISKDVIERLKFKEEGKQDNSNTKKYDKKTESWLTPLLKFVAPLAVVGGGLFASIKGMLSGNGIQGLNTILSKFFGKLLETLLLNIGPIGKMFTKGGIINKVFRELLVTMFGKGGALTKIFGQGLGKVLLGAGLGKAFLKRIPIIGSLISIGSAITRFQRGEILQGLIDIGAGVATMFPGVGTAIAVTLDLLNMTIDMATADGNNIVKVGLNMFTNWFKNNMRKMPVIGTFLYLRDAFQALANGDIDGFVKPFTGGLLGFIPGIFFIQDFINLTSKKITGEDSGFKVDILSAVDNMYNVIKKGITNFIKGSIDKLYNSLPMGLLNKALDFLGLSSFKQSGEQNWINRDASDILIGKKETGEKQDVNYVIDVLKDSKKSNDEIIEVLSKNRDNIDFSTFKSTNAQLRNSNRDQYKKENERALYEQEILELQKQSLRLQKQSVDETARMVQQVNTSTSNSVSHYNINNPVPLHKPYREGYINF